MAKDYPERDWKVVRKLKDEALNRFCERVFSEIKDTGEVSESTWHQRYLTVYQLIRERDREIAANFDGFSRSSALWKSAAMCTRGLIRDDELRALTPETQTQIRSIVEWESRP